MRAFTAALLSLLLAAGVAAQDPPAKSVPAGETASPAPLPEGQTKALQAVVMKVEGSAQWRPGSDAAFRDCKVNDLLSAGAEVRTGRKSTVTLRVGMNGTLLIDRQSRVSLPRVLQDGKVLRTTLALSFGQADVKVDRIGLETDFEVMTPTATLAVSGTLFRVSWDAVAGFGFRGSPGNRLHAVEAEYWESILAKLSGDDASNEDAMLPALNAFGQTFFLPPPGSLAPGKAAYLLQQHARPLPSLVAEPGLNVLRRARGAASVQRGPQGGDGINPPFGGFGQ
ncbi:MAG: FecR domain-containing protein [Planctomycetaceae bacterium]